MNGKGLIWMGMFIGSTLGSALPLLWDGGFFSYTIWGAVGGVAGIWAGFKLAKSTGTL